MRTYANIYGYDKGHTEWSFDMPTCIQDFLEEKAVGYTNKGGVIADNERTATLSLLVLNP